MGQARVRCRREHDHHARARQRGHGLNCTYDAWNRLVEVQSGSTVLATYSYDGLNRRITETAGGHTTAFFYDTNDQVLEERVDGATSANVQYVWGLRNVDDLALRDRNNGGGGNLGKTGSGLGERLYALQDANWNVVALVDTNGAVQERFTYTAYGTATALNPNFSSPYSGSTNFHWTTLLPRVTWTPPQACITTTCCTTPVLAFHHDGSRSRRCEYVSVCRRQPRGRHRIRAEK